MEKIETPFGYVTPLGETDEVSASVLEILPGRGIAKHYHKKMREIELILHGKISVDGVEKTEGELLVWEVGREHAHGYKNVSFDSAHVLCVATPPYDASDSYELK